MEHAWKNDRMELNAHSDSVGRSSGSGSGHSMRLEQLFRRCDTRGSGYIDRDAFREVCSDFDIDVADADIIFFDLDHDGDNKISFEDFAFGFRDFHTPGARRGSIQMALNSQGLSRQPSLRFPSIQETEVETMPSLPSSSKQKEMEQRHADAQQAWQTFASHLGEDDVKRFLNVSSDKIFGLYEELQTSEAPPHLVTQYEDVIAALMADVKNMENQTKRLQETMAKERENHTLHLRSIEAELDAQVARVESAAKEKAKKDHEEEKRQLQDKMEAEMAQLQSQLKIFQKIDSYLSKEKDETLTQEAQRRLDRAVEENRRLKASLNETQTNIALLRGELSHTRHQLDAKCSELHEERENRMEYVYEFDNLNRQLSLLRDANHRLQDANDGLRSVVDVSALNSPRPSTSRHEFSNLVHCSSITASDVSSDPDNENNRSSAIRRKKKHSNTASNLNNVSPRSTDTDLSRRSDRSFTIQRLMDDLDDSGTSTMPGDADVSNDIGVHKDNNNVPVAKTTTMAKAKVSREQKDRHLTEVGDHQEDHLEQGMAVRDHNCRPSTITRKPTPAPRKSSQASVATTSTLSSASVLSTSSSPKARVLSVDSLSPTGPPDRTYKVVFAGDAAVGKTSFINRLTKGVFVANLSSTLGVDFQVKTINVDERNIAIQLWDTAGQERFRSVTRSYFRRADGVMLLYDVTSDRSFLSVRQWIEAVDEVAEKRIPIMICGNKVDLRPNSSNNDGNKVNVNVAGRRCVTADEGERVAREHSAVFVETSAKDGKNVIDALVHLCRDMCSSEDVEVQTSALKIREEAGNTKKNNCCKK